MQKILQKLLLLFTVIGLSLPANADVVKPALVEVSVFSDGSTTVIIRTSVEALLTGIDGRYRNTQDAPNSEEYDRYRELESDELKRVFEEFHAQLLNGIFLMADSEKISLTLDVVDIPSPGYTKVPRISVIELNGNIPFGAKELQWYYPLRFGDQAVRVRQVNESGGEYHWSGYQWIKEDEPSKPFSLTEVYTKPTFSSIAPTYIEVGVSHIVPKGLDHILFVLGIFLISMRLRPLILQVTMFTVAHSITLSLGTYGLISLPPKVIEPMITLSIVYVAIENLLTDRLSRFRLPVVFGFGLLHGLGFASILTEFGLPEDLYLSALLWFNLGVEFGQLAILIGAYLAITIWFNDPSRYRRVITIPGSVLIGAIGGFWMLERVVYFYVS